MKPPRNWYRVLIDWVVAVPVIPVLRSVTT